MKQRLMAVSGRSKALLVLVVICALAGVAIIVATGVVLRRSTPVEAGPTPSPSPSLTTTATPFSTPPPTATSVPTPTAEPETWAWVELTGPVAYPGAMPYLGAIEAHLTEGTETVVAGVRCEGVMVLPGATGELTLAPEQAAYHFFVIPPGHTPRCAVTVAGQECGEWVIETGGEASTSLSCAVMPVGASR